VIIFPGYISLPKKNESEGNKMGKQSNYTVNRMDTAPEVLRFPGAGKPQGQNRKKTVTGASPDEQVRKPG